MLMKELLEMATQDNIFKLFQSVTMPGFPDADVIDVGKMSKEDIDAYNDDMDPKNSILWMHVAGGLLGAKRLSNMAVLDSEGTGNESDSTRDKMDDALQELANGGLFKKEHEVDLDNYEYGFGSIEYGSVLGIPCVEVSDHGMLAYVVLKKDIK